VRAENQGGKEVEMKIGLGHNGGKVVLTILVSWIGGFTLFGGASVDQLGWIGATVANAITAVGLSPIVLILGMTTWMLLGGRKAPTSVK
jgi:hypothetical protein